MKTLIWNKFKLKFNGRFSNHYFVPYPALSKLGFYELKLWMSNNRAYEFSQVLLCTPETIWLLNKSALVDKLSTTSFNMNSIEHKPTDKGRPFIQRCLFTQRISRVSFKFKNLLHCQMTVSVDALINKIAVYCANILFQGFKYLIRNWKKIWMFNVRIVKCYFEHVFKNVTF
jgi:hypothetical protein